MSEEKTSDIFLCFKFNAVQQLFEPFSGMFDFCAILPRQDTLKLQIEPAESLLFIKKESARSFHSISYSALMA